MTVVISLVLAYLLGSIPSAYIVTRLATGKDIRKLGSGNVGANNVFREISLKAAIPVVIVDVGKGAAAAAIASRLLNVPSGEPPVFVLLAGIAAVAGHIWPVFLRFSGGNGLGTTMGVMAIVMPRELLIVIAILLVAMAVTRNLVLSVNIGLLWMPLLAWLLEKEWLYVGFCIVLMVMMVLNFIPTARAASARAGSKKSPANRLLRRGKR